MNTVDLETLLFDILVAHDPEPPPPAEVAEWCARFPEHARGIRAFVGTWVTMDLAKGRVPKHYRWVTQTG